MLKWAVGQRYPTPGQHVSAYSSVGEEAVDDSPCFRRTVDGPRVPRRRSGKSVVRKAAVRSLRRVKRDDKENRPCLSPENASSRTRDSRRSGHLPKALRDVSNSPDPYAVTPKRHLVKRRKSHPLNLIAKNCLGEHSKSAPANAAGHVAAFGSPRPKPLPPVNLPQLCTASQKTPRNYFEASGQRRAELSDVVDMRKPNSTLKSLLTMQIEYSPGPLTATQSLVTLRQRLTKSLSSESEAAPQGPENPLYYALNPAEKRANNGITISCNEPSPTLEGLLEEKSILEQVSDKFEFINSLSKENSRIENTLVSSLSQRLEWLRLNNNFNNASLLREGDDASLGDDQGAREKDRQRVNARKRRDGDPDKSQVDACKKVKPNCDGACGIGRGNCCDNKPKTLDKPKLTGLTLALGTPSPVTLEDSGLCSLGLEGIHPLSSSPIESQRPGALTEETVAKYREEDEESVSASLVVECSPSSPCPSFRKRLNESDGSRDAWSEEVVPLVKTPKLANEGRFKGEPSFGAGLATDDVLPSPLALVEKRSRSRRCLRFVSPSGSTCSRHLASSRRPLSLSCPRLRDGREGPGELELSVNCTKDQMIVHVGRGTDLNRPSGAGCNAYVKVALVPSSERTFFRTPVHRESACPNFNETFSFKFHPKDLNKQILVSVWHRDRDNRKSEFLGCVSLAVKNAIRKEISGSFRLVAQSGGSKTSNQQRSVQSSPGPPTSGPQSVMARHSGNSRPEDVITVDEEVESCPEKQCKFAGKKRHDDDGSFLRHLELEPAEGEGGRGPLPEATAKGGRTPFTTTKQLTKHPGTGFGFSIAWVRPPRVERVEAGQSADRAGIRPGDHVVFVDRHNVVAMTEEQVLQIIRSCGNELTLEIYRKAGPNGVVDRPTSASSAGCGRPAQSSAACSASASLDFSRRRLHFPQVAFNNEDGRRVPEDPRKRAIYQLVAKEQNYATDLRFGIDRFLVPLTEKREFLNPTQHRILFQNVEELLRLTEDTMEQAAQEDVDSTGGRVGRLYLKRMPTLAAAYRRYCAGIKRADCLLAEKSKNAEFTRFCAEPPIPRRRPDLTTFLHKPLQHYREVVKLLQTILNLTEASDADHPALSKLANEMQGTFREVTAGLMEPEVEGRPLLSVQDLESRLVFTRCKPFVLSVPGRRWIFGGDLSRVDGRAVRPFWALLFTDMMVFAKVSRDRVLFVTEEPLSLLAVTQAYFNVRKRANEFRLLLSGRGTGTESPANATCGPDVVLSRTPKKNSKCRSVALRAPTPELKAVWQNLIQRQIIYLNTTRGMTPAGSPLDSPDPAATLSAATPDSPAARRQARSHELKNASLTQKLYQDVKEISATSEGCARRINQIIDHKCRQLGKTKTGREGAMHLAHWMKDQLGSSGENSGPEARVPGSADEGATPPHAGSSDEEPGNLRWWREDADASPQIRARTNPDGRDDSPRAGERTVSVCRRCRKTCLGIWETHDPGSKGGFEEDDDPEAPWGPPATGDGLGVLRSTLISSVDPFVPAEPPSISVLPPTPDRKSKNTKSKPATNCNGYAKAGADGINVAPCVADDPFALPRFQTVPDDEDEDDEDTAEELPYKSLSSPALKRFGTFNSLERVGSEDALDREGREAGGSGKEEEEEEEPGKAEADAVPPGAGVPTGGWTARAGSFVAAKMAFFERFGSPDNSVTVRKTTFLERCLRPSGERHLDASPEPGANTPSSGRGEDEGETSAATSGEEVWGTPTSGGELEEDFPGEASAPSFTESPRGSFGIDDDTEQLMEDLLISLPMLAARTHGVPPRRRLEPLPEEDDAESFSAPCSPKPLRGAKVDQVRTPDQKSGRFEVGDVPTPGGSAENDIKVKRCQQGRGSPGARRQRRDDVGVSEARRPFSRKEIVGHFDWTLGARSDDDDDDGDGDQEEDDPETLAKTSSLFRRFGLKRNVSRRERSRKRNRLLGFLSGRKVDAGVARNSATYGAKPLFRYLFNRDPDDGVPTAVPGGYPPSAGSERQLERRFWKQLKKRRTSPETPGSVRSTSRQISV